MNTEEKNRIACILGEYLLRVVKNNNYYLTFKKTFFENHKFEGGQYANTLKECFKHQNVFNDAMMHMAISAENEFKEHRHDNSAYEYITIFINMVLRTYLEAGGVDPRKLGMVGQELFDLTCFGVYGDKYLSDMEEMNRQKGNMRAPRNDKEAWLMAEYEHRIRNGENLDFETFMRERTSVSDEEFWNDARRRMNEHGADMHFNDDDNF